MCACFTCGGCAAAVDHYAGLVTYDSTNFVEKNRDAMLVDLVDVWESSSSPLMKTIAVEASAGNRVVSQSSQFKGQVCAARAAVFRRFCDMHLRSCRAAGCVDAHA
jgi:myosin heavy subunit